MWLDRDDKDYRRARRRVDKGFAAPISMTNGCWTKTKFPSKRVAKGRCRAIFRNTGDRMVFYRCSVCKGWHLATKS